MSPFMLGPGYTRPEPTSRVHDTISGHVCEEGFYDASGEMVGYWAYGHYEPWYPYQGYWLSPLEFACLRAWMYVSARFNNWLWSRFNSEATP